MPDTAPIAIDVRGVSKDYRGLRPLRVQHLEVRQGQSVALLGFDAAMAEVLVNLITGATLPDTGEVTVLGQSTAAITSGDEWLKTLERFGLIGERSVLVDQFTVEQNLAIPFSLEIDELGPRLKADVRRLADEVGLTVADLAQPTATISAAARVRLRLGRALALNPRVLLAEHPTASLSADDTPTFAADVSRIISARGLATVIVTADRTFAAAVAEQVLTLEPATGVLKRSEGWRRWFS
jgi:ABC-type transporter Mla maintaining outer membrane lipid asymmetry ATPase subunit MlaF